jgi:hypothetical protein
MNAYPSVKKVVAADDYKLILSFSNGEVRMFDVKPFLNKGIFRELKNISLFQTVHVSFDTIEWDNAADFDPEDLYALSKKMKNKKNAEGNKMSEVAEPRVRYAKKKTAVSGKKILQKKSRSKS